MEVLKRLCWILALLVYGCEPAIEARKPIKQETFEEKNTKIQEKLNEYISVELTTDLEKLSSNQITVLSILIDAAKITNELFWYQSYGEDYTSLLDSLEDTSLRKFVEINYGPWNRLEANNSFIEGIGKKPLGANFYPKDMTKDEFESTNFFKRNNQYSFVRRNDEGKLYEIPYHKQFSKEIAQLAQLLDSAALITEDISFKEYLKLRSKALLSDDYRQSDMAWMDMKSNVLDIVVGPIETYEDQLFGNKTAYESYVLVKDIEWSQRLSKLNTYLPQLQKDLPVDKKYKRESPGLNSDLNVYDVVYYAGDCNSGSKTIAINLPNDEIVQLEKGTRKLQLKNAIQAKFDNILVPISTVLIAEHQQKHITFDAFFENIMFHEIAHGLGIKNTIDNKSTVRLALKEYAGTLEEGKADVLGLFMINQLTKQEVLENHVKDNMVSFMVGIFRSIRFGATSAHGRANLVRFNFFKEKGVFTRNFEGKYAVNFDKMEFAMRELSAIILRLQGDGDYNAVKEFMKKYNVISPELQNDLNKLADQNIPVDIIFEQGQDVLGI